jgi:enoyl-CoA hydratase/carnithine racemase
MSNIVFEYDNNIATIVLDRPAKLNTITPQMTKDLIEIAASCNDDDTIRVVILTGAGEKAFCAGSDLGELDTYDTHWRFRNRLDYCDAIRSIRKPVIAAINGYAYGGGLELSLSSDIRIASETAIFCAAEIKLGWIGGGGVSFFLTHNIGASNAARMILTGDPIDAKTAFDWKLISDTYRPDELLHNARELAEKISRNAPVAAQIAKDNIRAAYRLSADEAVKYERDLQTICMATKDAEEGQKAFKQKRKPVFKGK